MPLVLLNRVLLVCFVVFAASVLKAQQFNALLITETAGWHHESITAAVPALEGLAERHHFGLDRYQSGEPLTAKLLARYDVIIMVNTTGDIFTEQEQAAFEAFIRSGKGFVGVHAASDTEYDWPWYTQLVGRMLVIHPAIQTAMLDVADTNFPGLANWPKRLLWTDEWYEFSEEKVAGLHYLLSVDESTFDPEADWGRVAGKGMGDFHPIAWYHEFAGGRSFYTALGHIPAVYQERLFLEHLYGGIYWAATGRGL
ncbi:MAG: ThuA domain-containing protein [Bacteroidota bacterium]